MSPSFNHAAIAVTIGAEINKDRTFRAFSELSLLIDGKEYLPDISVYPWRKLNLNDDIVKTTEMPLLAIEIVSPFQGVQDLIEKAKVYLRAGIRSVWLVHPFTRSISVITPEGTTHYHEGTLHDPTGMTLDLAAIFDA